MPGRFYEFTINHVMHLDRPDETYRLTLENLQRDARTARTRPTDPQQKRRPLRADHRRDVRLPRQLAERVRTCGALNTDRVAAVYGVDPTQVKYFDADVAMAIKITIPRPTPSGSLSDTDIFGGQVRGPLVRLEIP